MCCNTFTRSISMQKSFALLSENMRPRSPGLTTEGSRAALLSYLHAHHASSSQLAHGADTEPCFRCTSNKR